MAHKDLGTGFLVTNTLEDGAICFISRIELNRQRKRERNGQIKKEVVIAMKDVALTFMYLLRPVSLGALDPSSTASLVALSLSLWVTAALWSLTERLSEGSHVFALKPLTSSLRSLLFLPEGERGKRSKGESERVR